MRSPTFRMFYQGKVVTVGWHPDPMTPTEVEGARRRSRKFWLGMLGVLVGGMLVFWRFVPEIPVDYTDPVEHFKYGSIGTEEGNGLPYWIWKVLPVAFPEHLPAGSGKNAGYGSFGFTYESTKAGDPMDTPIGFSKRRLQGVERVGMNCAVCHTSTYREAPGSEPVIVPSMPAHKLDLLAYFQYLFDCAEDGRFTTDYLLAQIDATTKLGPIERAIYKVAIPITRERILMLRSKAKFMLDHPSGPGRIDTFTPYKTVQFGFEVTKDFHVGNADFPSIWNQKPREGLDLHWDGNNSSVDERNKSASMGAGATPVSLDLPRLARVRDWIWTLPAPSYPAKLGGVDKGSNARGAATYQARCAGCHDLGAPRYQVAEKREYGVGQVVPIAEIGTDRERLDSYSFDLNQNQYTLGAGTAWRFKHFRKTDGYASMPLDGIWARAPYLHNGSVPSLRDLLDSPYSADESAALKWPEPTSCGPVEVKSLIKEARAASRRPPLFYRGDDVFDRDRVGFVADRAESEGRRLRVHDVRVLGNGNAGHLYGTDLPAADKDALVSYLRSL